MVVGAAAAAQRPYVRQHLKPPTLTAATDEYTPAEVYCGLRDQVLRLPGERASTGFSGVVGALMETGYQEAVATLVVLADGTTSLYFSNGGGVIGAGQHKPVAAASSAFLQAAQQNLSLMQSTVVFPLPRLKHARFYVLDTSGSWTSEAVEQDLGYNREKLSPLFHLAHAVIAAVRKNSRPPGAA
jgi:hypothetical protein